jgi:hypothetical protein
MTKSTITIELDIKVKQALERRAKKEMLELDQLISDILRRSVLSYKGNTTTDNLDDKFLSYFSRKQKVDYLKTLKDKIKGKKSKPFYESVMK